MNYLEIRALRHNTDVKNLLEVAIAKASMTILSEAADAPDHANRVALAKAAAKTGQTISDKLMWVIALNTSMQSAVSADIATQQTVVQAVVDGALASPAVVQALLSL